MTNFSERMAFKMPRGFTECFFRKIQQLACHATRADSQDFASSSDNGAAQPETFNSPSLGNESEHRAWMESPRHSVLPGESANPATLQ